MKGFMQTPIEFGKSFLNAYYRNQDATQALAFLAEDVIWVTPDEVFHLREQSQIYDFLKKTIEERKEPYYVDVADICADNVSEEIRSVTYSGGLVPKDPAKAVRIRFTLVIRSTKDGFEITSLHVSRKYSRSDTTLFHEFINRIPGEVMIILGLGQQGTRQIYRNTRLQSKLGYTDKEWADQTKKDPFFMFTDADRKQIQASFSDPGKEKEIKFPVTARAKDGKRCRLMLTGKYAYDEDDGKVSYLVLQDITDLARERAELSDRVKMLSAMADHLPCEAVIVRFKVPTIAEPTPPYSCRLIFMSRGIPALFGSSTEEVSKGITADMFFGAELPYAQKDYLLRTYVYEGLKTQEVMDKTVTFHRGDNKGDLKVRLSMTGYPDLRAGIPGGSRPATFIICINYTDVTDFESRKAGIEENAAKRVNEAQEQAKIAVGKAAEAERLAAETAQKADETLKAKLSEAADRNDEKIAALNQKNAGIIDNKDAQIQALTERIGKLTDEKASMTDAIMKAKDEAEEARMASTAFLGKMHGNMRKPSSAILYALKELENTSDEDTAQLLAENIREAAYSMQDQVDNLMEMATVKSEEFRTSSAEFVFRDLVNEISGRLAQACAAKKIDYRLEMDNSKVPEIMTGDRVSLRKTLESIADNATEYTAQGGQIRFEVESTQPERGFIPIKFSITDTGPGIDDELMKHMYEPFVRSTDNAEPGFGLGLAIADRLVRAVGGSIGASSTPGVGTCFTVSVSLKPAVEQSGRTKSVRNMSDKSRAVYTGQNKGFAGKRVLLAEDDPLNMEVIKRLLENKGMIVERAGGGRTAVSGFREKNAGYYDVILADYHMPQVDGLELARQVRGIEKGKHVVRPVPIIALTENAFEEDMAGSFTGLISSGVSKPVDQVKLFDALRWAFSQSHK